MFDSKVYKFILYVEHKTSSVHQNIKDVLKAALESGITLFQFREKGPNALVGDEKEALAKELKTLCHEYKVPFLINDDVDLAEKIDADGIHVGQDDEIIASFANRFKIKL